MFHTVCVACFVFFLTTLNCVALAAANDGEALSDLLKLDIRALAQVKITSASKKPEILSDIAAAVYVISNDDIRRSGLRSIPEVLRLAPGVEVQNTNANMYSISIRGQNDLYSDKLLILMDGRPLYTTTFSGVWWPAQNYPLEDVERIEVIRGPSGAIWGSNAVNGVINIITKQASDTQGVLLSTGAGNEEKGFGTLRLGGSNDSLDYRAYVMAENRDGGILSGGQAAQDYRRLRQAGFRADWQYDNNTTISLHGDIYDMNVGAFGDIVTVLGQRETPYRRNNMYSGRNLVLDMKKQLASGIRISTQGYYDYYGLNIAFIDEKKDTYDASLQLDFPQYYSQSVSVGAEYRHSQSRFTNTPAFQMKDRSHNMFSLFINDDIELIANRLRLIAGLKAERNTFSSWEMQPTLRVIYTHEHWSAWAAASRAIRSTNLIENDLIFNVRGFPGAVVRVIGNGQVDPEKVTAFEGGFRYFPNDHLLFQIAAFSLRYHNVQDAHTQRNNAFLENGIVVIPVIFRNILKGRAIGFETDVTWQAVDWLRLQGSYSFLNQQYDPWPIIDNETQISATTVTHESPRHRFRIGASLNPTSQLELDTNLYYYSSFRKDRFSTPTINQHFRLDARIAWKPIQNLELSLVGQNLLRSEHQENISNTLENASLVQRAFYTKLTYHY